MAQNRLGGSGLGLPYPQSLTPMTLSGAPTAAASNAVSLNPGQALVIPGGDYMVATGRYTLLQYLDPVTTGWLPVSGSAGEVRMIHSDGANFRIANLTGCAIGGIVTAIGSNYVQASTTITASAGGSTWQPIIGGAISATTTVTTAGSGYTIAPVVFIPAPPSPGVQATAVATISSGTVSGVTIVNQGAGYTSFPGFTLLPSPYDPTASSVVQARATGTITNSGALTAVICTNNGAPIAAPGTPVTLTVAGVGASATAVATMCFTMTGATVGGAGVAYGTNTILTTAGGLPAGTTVQTNPQIERNILQPRPALMIPTITGATITSVATVVDGGLFAGVPLSLVLSNAVYTTAATVTLTPGSVSDVSYIQPC